MISTAYSPSSVAEPPVQFRLDNQRLLDFLQTQPDFAQYLGCTNGYHLTSNSRFNSFSSNNNSSSSSSSTATIHTYQFKHGQSNPTYLLIVGEGEHKFVLRKQPPGLLLKGAHQVLREAAILQYLHQHAPGLVPVPNILVVCSDAGVIGTPFYIMEHIEGVIYTDPKLPSLSPPDRQAVYLATATVLRAIHAVDVATSPLVANNSSSHSSNGSSHSSSSYSSSSNGSNSHNSSRIHSSTGSGREFASRQVHTWTQQYHKSSASSGHQVPEMDALISWLTAHLPAHDQPTTICHGDFRLDNIIFDANDPSRVLAVLDWELTTVGSPLADVAYCCLSHHLPPVGFLRKLSLLDHSQRQPTPPETLPQTLPQTLPTALPQGVPTEEAFVATYLSTTTHHAASITSPQEWKFYLALGLFRAASIASGVFARSLQGNASSGEEAQAFAMIVPVLAKTALRLTGSAGSASSEAHRGRLSGVPAVSLGTDPSPACRVLLQRLRDFNNEWVIPAEAGLIAHYHHAEGQWPQRGDRWTIHPQLLELVDQARLRGLWNLWLPEGTVRALRKDHPQWDWAALLPHQHGLTHVDYAHIAMESGRSLFTPQIINCSAPDTGNMEIIAKFGTVEQRERWLLPLLQGEIRSCFGMTEPNLSSSDPTQLRATATRLMSDDVGGSGSSSNSGSGSGSGSGSSSSSGSGSGSGSDGGDEQWVVSGEKWWTTGATDPRCKVCIFVALTEEGGGSGRGSGGGASSSSAAYRRHTLFLLPMDDPGITVGEWYRQNSEGRAGQATVPATNSSAVVSARTFLLHFPSFARIHPPSDCHSSSLR